MTLKHPPPDRDEPRDIWTIYDSPLDMPGFFVLRRHIYMNDATHEPTDEIYACKAIEPLREKMRRQRLTCLPRHPSDDPLIVEVWL